jgi:hypothetical protein
MIERIRKRRRIRSAQVSDIERMHPDEAAQLLRNFMRADIGDRETRLALAERGMQSESRANAAAMEKYLAAIKAGRRIKYDVFPVRFLEYVPADLEAAVEDALQGDEQR